MADYGRISSSIAEAAVTVPTGDAVARVDSVIAEVAHDLPTGDALARVNSVIAEVAHDLPTGDALARVNSVIAEVAHDETGDEARVAFVMIEVFSKAPTQKPPKRPSIGGGVQGTGVSTFR
jgi:hypothetical protein